MKSNLTYVYVCLSFLTDNLVGYFVCVFQHRFMYVVHQKAWTKLISFRMWYKIKQNAQSKQHFSCICFFFFCLCVLSHLTRLLACMNRYICTPAWLRYTYIWQMTSARLMSSHRLSVMLLQCYYFFTCYRCYYLKNCVIFSIFLWSVSVFKYYSWKDMDLTISMQSFLSILFYLPLYICSLAWFVYWTVSHFIFLHHQDRNAMFKIMKRIFLLRWKKTLKGWVASSTYFSFFHVIPFVLLYSSL